MASPRIPQIIKPKVDEGEYIQLSKCTTGLVGVYSKSKPKINHRPTKSHDESAMKPCINDALYDFPRPTLKHEAVGLNAVVPISGQHHYQTKNAYSNAPPGFFKNKQSFETYDYRPTLPVPSSDPELPPRSPRTPNSDNTPPPVNRNLKPRRHDSPTNSPGHYNLAPTPAMRRGVREKKEDHPGLQYLDLDCVPPTPSAISIKSLLDSGDSQDGIYKTVDFVKTKAFNIVRKKDHRKD